MVPMALLENTSIRPFDRYYVAWLIGKQNKAGLSWWSPRKTGKLLRVSDTTIRESRKRLVAAGLLEITNSKGGELGPGQVGYCKLTAAVFTAAAESTSPESTSPESTAVTAVDISPTAVESTNKPYTVTRSKIQRGDARPLVTLSDVASLLSAEGLANCAHWPSDWATRLRQQGRLDAFLAVPLALHRAGAKAVAQRVRDGKKSGRRNLNAAWALETYEAAHVVMRKAEVPATAPPGLKGAGVDTRTDEQIVADFQRQLEHAARMNQ